MDNILYSLNLFFLIYISIYCIILLIGVLIGLRNMYISRLETKYRNQIKRDYYLPISVILPAYNEELTIVESVKSLLNIEYKNYEIIIVDDGSNDLTSKKVIEEFDLHNVTKASSKKIKTSKVNAYYSNTIKDTTITLVKKENGGKADSINAGINISKFSYFIAMDADSILAPDAVEKIVKPVIESADTIAVGGSVKLINNYKLKDGKLLENKTKSNFLTTIQEIIYDRTFLSSKFLFDLFNGNLIISGAFGLFKKDIVVNCGGYSVDTVGEDMELVLKLHRYCRKNKIKYKIKYIESARCYTQSPIKYSDFYTQQKRWYTGLLQSLVKYKSIFLNFKYGAISFISYTYMFLFELLAPIVETIGLVFLFLGLFTIRRTMLLYLNFLLIYIAFCSLVSIASYMLRIYNENFENLSLKKFLTSIFYCIVENLGFRQYVNFKRLTVLFNYRKNKTAWKKLERIEIGE